jgi:hypothetical protein
MECFALVALPLTSQTGTQKPSSEHNSLEHTFLLFTIDSLCAI